MRLGDWLLVALSMTFSLALAELLLRLFSPPLASAYRPDDALLISPVPGARKVYNRLPVNGGQHIVVEFNSDGFRGESLRPLLHQKRVIVYGDSNVEADFSELAATFPKQLESRLKRDLGSDVEAVNAGVIGYGPDQVTLRLPGELEKFKPALVVVVIFADNDYGDLIRNRIYRLNPRGDLTLNRYGLSPDLRDRMQTLAYPRGLRRLQLRRYAAALWGMLREKLVGPPMMPDSEYFTNYVDISLARNQQTFQEYVIDRPDGGYSADPLDDYYDADIALQPDSPSARYKVALMEKVLVKLRDTAAQAGTGLILTILPSPVDACDHYDMQVDARRYPQYDRSRLSGLVEDMAVRNGIPYLSLWYAFRVSGADRLYFRGGDTHWNDAGQAEAARRLADLIERLHLLQKP
jgi:GDSL-like Lipase/Acylhydrolase family